jgi:hypothetical protein
MDWRYSSRKDMICFGGAIGECLWGLVDANLVDIQAKMVEN